MKIAVIDLGTNTFQLLIVEKQGDILQKIKEVSLPAKIGKGGINQQIITEEAIQRALEVLKKFNQIVDSQEVKPEYIFAIGTSAIRNAANKNEFISRVFEETNIKIQVISGEEEAELIYTGVKETRVLGKDMAMIMDIGGGSVEFIICKDDRIFWKQSFEIGGQRLMERFMKTDPISLRSIQMMDEYFRQQLLPLTNAIHQYSPKIMIGSSGTFDTLIDIFFMKNYGHLPPKDEQKFELPINAFYESYEKIVLKNHAERMAISGMIELRVDMIVVAMCLIRFVIQTFDIQRIMVSNFALKEGAMSKILNELSDNKI